MTARDRWVSVTMATFGLAALAVFWAIIRVQAADLDLRRALDRHAQTQRAVERLAMLRAVDAHISVGPRPDVDLISRCQQALVDAGLPAAACSGVQPRSDQALAQAGLRVQTVQVVFQDLTPAQFGAWLGAWASRASGWRITDLQLIHAPIRLGAGGDLDNNHYGCTVALAAPYLQEHP